MKVVGGFTAKHNSSILLFLKLCVVQQLEKNKISTGIYLKVWSKKDDSMLFAGDFQSADFPNYLH